MDITFDRLKEAELGEIAKLYDAERIGIVTSQEKMKKVFKQIENNPDYILLTAKKEGKIVAFAKIVVHEDIFEECKPYMTIWSVRVKKEDRRNKIGTVLFQKIEELAKQRNCDFLCLCADKENSIANAFYQSLKYTKVNGYIKKL